MKFKAKKDDLLQGIQTVQNVISSKISLPVLSNILVEAQEDKIRLTATDLDVGITCVLPVDVQEQGAVTIPAKRFSDIVRDLPAEEVSIAAKKNNQVNIDAGSCQFKIMGLPYEEFPRLPELKDKEVVRLQQSDLQQMLVLTSFAASADATRYVLNGILFKVQADKLTLVATDGKRLAVADCKLSRGFDRSSSIIVPIKAIHELGRNLREGAEVSLIIGNNQALFDLGQAVIVSRLIEGEFPDYRQVIPQPSENKMRADRQGFLLAVKRAALLSTPDYQAVKLELFKNKLVVSKSTPDIGESREEMAVEYQGKELAIGFNPYYLIDCLKNIAEEKITIEDRKSVV